MSASANYGVSIAEDFQPPENWVPGQTINKDVSAVNTGNVDAFVRMWLEGEMSVLARTTQTDAAQVSAAASNKIEPVTDTKYTSLGLNYYNAASGQYYKELSQAKVKNPELNDSGDADESGANENIAATFSEVQAVQAGGYLAYAPSGAKYYFILEHATSVQGYATANDAELKNFELKEGDIIATKGATIPTLTSGQTAVYIADGTYGIDIDSSDFYPQTEGTYLFRRNIKLTKTTTGDDAAQGVNEQDDYEYSGYYFVPKAGGTDGLLKAADANNAHYFALYTDRTTAGGSDRSDYTIPDNAVSTTATGDVVDPSKNVVKVHPVDAQLKFYTAKETVVQNSDLKWTYTAPVESPAAPAKLTAYYAGIDGNLGRQRTGSGTSASPYVLDNSADDDIVIDITLANIGTEAENWTVENGTGTKVNYFAPTVTDASATATELPTNALWTFYYNNDVEAGDTTTMLVDSVKLSENTTQHAFLAFDFDLNVFL